MKFDASHQWNNIKLGQSISWQEEGMKRIRILFNFLEIKNAPLFNLSQHIADPSELFITIHVPTMIEQALIPGTYCMNLPAIIIIGTSSSRLCIVWIQKMRDRRLSGMGVKKEWWWCVKNRLWSDSSFLYGISLYYSWTWLYLTHFSLYP